MMMIRKLIGTTITYLTQKTRTWKKFSNTERWLVLQALILFPLVASFLKLWGLKRTYYFWSFFLSEPEPRSLSLLHTTVRSVQIAAKYHTWATCLRKSLVLWFLLRRQKIAAELQIGTRFEGKEFQAHAWVEYQGNVIGDRHSVQQHFTTFNNLNL